MMQSELLQPSWPYYDTMDSSLDEMGSFEFSPSFMSMEEYSSDVSSSFPYFSPMDLPIMFPMEQGLINMEKFIATTDDQDHLLFNGVEDLCEWMEEKESGLPSQQLCIEEDVWCLSPSMISSEASMNVPSAQPLPLVLPEEDMDLDGQLSILHLLKAYGEAMEMEHKELATEILRRLKQKASPSPTGAIVERLAYYFMQGFNKQVDYLREESSKNYEVAFKAFYQIFPLGRFAHFIANSVILEAIPEDAETIHIVDFDIGEGVQWPPLIEALGRQRQRMVKLTSIKWDEEDGRCSPYTRKRLFEHAQSFGVKLKMEEMDMEVLVSEMKKTKKRGGGSEWFAFNCMVGLPHMGRGRSIRHVTEFLEVAKNTIHNPIKNSHGNISNKGVMTLGDGNGSEARIGVGCGFGSLFEGHLLHLLALFESMERHFPLHLTAARIATECLFLAPHVSSLAHLQKWEDITREGSALFSEIGAWRMSKDSFLEAKELVRVGESQYWVRIEGENENQMVLGFMETPLVRVASWR